MKKYFILLLAILVLPSINAIDIDVDVVNSSNVMVPELDKPAIFTLNITNNGATQDFRIFTPIVDRQEPFDKTNDYFEIKEGESMIMDYKLYPPLKGNRNLEYYIEGGDNEGFTGVLSIDYVELRDVFNVGSANIHPERNSVEIYVENTIGMNFDEVNADFSSPFFDMEETFSIGPHERKVFEKELNSEEFNRIRAGFYTLNSRISVQGETTNVAGTIEFESSEGIETSRNEHGFFVNTESVTKTNVGNVDESVTVQVDKGIISRMFTSVSPRPDTINRDGTNVYYTWERNLGPGESLNVDTTTNWVYPLAIIILLVAAVVGIKRYMQTDLKIKKQTKFVKSKGDEFALRVDIFVEARRPVENIVLIERLPPLLKLYKKFGKEKPKKVDENAKKMEWEFNSLEPGEKRIVSYVAYSKVKVVGKFALPKTTGVYERDGKIKEAASNRIYFVSEQNSKKQE